MKKMIALLALFTAPAGAFADDICDDLWLTRNILMDRAGYCFGTALGKAVFSNENCTTKSPVLSAADKEIVARVRQEEQLWACNVDTATRRLQVDDIAVRFRLHDQPVKGEFASACIGWLGDPVPLLSGHDHGAMPLGTIELGDSVQFGHWSEGDWDYVTVRDPDQKLKGGGWVPFSEINFDQCRSGAG